MTWPSSQPSLGLAAQLSAEVVTWASETMRWSCLNPSRSVVMDELPPGVLDELGRV